MFDETEKGKLVEGFKEKGDIVKVTNKKNNLCSSVLNGYGRGKIAFVKAIEKDVAVIKM